MAGDAVSDRRVEPTLDGTGVRVAVVAGRFNDLVTHRLLDGVPRDARMTQVGGGEMLEPVSGDPLPLESCRRGRVAERAEPFGYLPRGHALEHAEAT